MDLDPASTESASTAGIFQSFQQRTLQICCNAVCSPRRLWRAFRSEWKDHSRRMTMFRTGSANVKWPEVFGTSPWLLKTSLGLLIFRCAMAVTFVAFFTWSIAISFQDFYWFIYLTHWSLCAETLYFCFACVTTFAAWKQLRDPDYGTRSDVLPWFVQVTWLLLHIQLPASLMVFLMYWTLVNPVYDLQYVPDACGFFVHGINFFLCLTDLFVGRNVFYLKYAIWFFVYSVLYLLWSLIHFWLRIGTFDPCDTKSSTGTYDPEYPRDECPIYPVLDWHKPTATGILCGILLLIVVPLCQLPLWWCAKGRRALDCLRREECREPFTSVQQPEPLQDAVEQ